jgi:hypothetical protein
MSHIEIEDKDNEEETWQVKGKFLISNKGRKALLLDDDSIDYFMRLKHVHDGKVYDAIDCPVCRPKIEKYLESKGYKLVKK